MHFKVWNNKNNCLSLFNIHKMTTSCTLILLLQQILFTLHCISHWYTKTLTQQSDLLTYTNWMNLVFYNNLMEFFLYTCKIMYEIYASLRVYRYFTCAHVCRGSLAKAWSWMLQATLLVYYISIIIILKRNFSCRYQLYIYH